MASRGASTLVRASAPQEQEGAMRGQILRLLPRLLPLTARQYLTLPAALPAVVTVKSHRSSCSWLPGRPCCLSPPPLKAQCSSWWTVQWGRRAAAQQPGARRARAGEEAQRASRMPAFWWIMWGGWPADPSAGRRCCSSSGCEPRGVEAARAAAEERLTPACWMASGRSWSRLPHASLPPCLPLRVPWRGTESGSGALSKCP